MPLVEVFEDKDADGPSFAVEFAFLPREGEYLSREVDGHFRYYGVIEVWHRQDGEGGPFRPCIRVELDD